MSEPFWFSRKFFVLFINVTSLKRLTLYVETSRQSYLYRLLNMQKFPDSAHEWEVSLSSVPYLPPQGHTPWEDGSLGGCGCHTSFWRRGPFNHRFPIQIRCPVNQVESAKEDWEYNSGHFVDLADAVVSLFAFGGLIFGRIYCD